MLEEVVKLPMALVWHGPLQHTLVLIVISHIIEWCVVRCGSKNGHQTNFRWVFPISDREDFRTS